MLIFRYSARELLRHPARSLLAVLGVAVACAMLLDMLMLGGGLNASFRSLLTSAGYELRVSPAGTLPFDTGATIGDASGVRLRLESEPGIDAVAPVLGSNLLIENSRGAGPDEGTDRLFVLGVDPAEQGIYRLTSGVDPDENGVVIGRELADTGLAIGDSISLRAPGSFAEAGRRTGSFRVTGVADFLYASSGERSAAVTLPTLAQLTDQPDRASLMMVRITEGENPDSVAAALRLRHPELEIASVGQLVETAARRLSYFRQLAAILGTVSLVVTTLLIGTIMAISINDRYGTIAALRAIGISKRSIVAAFLVESLLLCVLAAAVGLGLGLLVAGQLERILSDFPGLPSAIRFFVFEPDRLAWAAAGVLLAGVGAALVPAIRAMNAPIAATLHREEP
ncbi:MAG: ABC transporter permease [marine benthic group bacterium]|nr:ABC transporter permease [Gemmatimonadota bacterium]MCL7963463.1 ABC transporter permease [Candidatus Carthagonibacter metallireducens]MCL7957291.1 ABC transporter permease [Gemmatimonadota bacterium]MCL7964994.1 ABC transporter permease [Gemmatimonadota bacterium]MCL7968020.1 ABC transporter permease [Gemmatimonadota bacterium]